MGTAVDLSTVTTLTGTVWNAMNRRQPDLQSGCGWGQEGAVGVVHEIQGQPGARLPVAGRVQGAQAADAALKDAPPALLVHVGLTVAGHRCHNAHLRTEHKALTALRSFRETMYPVRGLDTTKHPCLHPSFTAVIVQQGTDTTTGICMGAACMQRHCQKSAGQAVLIAQGLHGCCAIVQ